MRIVAGSLRGKKLASFDGKDIRPTSDRVREALFSILTSRLGSLEGLAILDLFAGSGALALEALSRGAARAVLIEGDERSAAVIRRNLAACRFDDRATLVRGELPRALDRLGATPFDLIFVDPPYGRGLAAATLQRLAELNLTAAAGVIAVETGAGEELPAVAGELSRYDRRTYGATALTFYERTQRAP